VWALVRAWPERSTIASVLLFDADSTPSSNDRYLSESVVIADPGEYEFVVCVGQSPETCEPEPSGERVEAVGNLDIDALQSGHNLATADRVNLVVVGHHYPSASEFLTTARTLFDLSGSPIEPGDGLVAEGEAGALWFPPFAVDPLRANSHKFNLWHAQDLGTLDDLVLSLLGRQATEPPTATEIDAALAAFGLANLAFVHIWDGPSPGGIATMPTFAGELDPHATAQTAAFGQAWITGVPHGSDPTRPAQPPVSAAHEMGHSLFGLTTEAPLAPVCAATVAEAEDWWGDLIGTVDPYFYEWRQTLQYARQWNPQPGSHPEAAVTVGINSSPALACIQPVEDAVMVSARTPVWGAVDRRRIETILEPFTGTATLTPDLANTALGITCRLDNGTVVCHGALAPYIDPPTNAIRIRAGGPPVTCTVEPSPPPQPTPVTCPPLTQTSEVVEASINDSPWTPIVALDTPPTSTPTATPQTTAPTRAPDTSTPTLADTPEPTAEVVAPPADTDRGNNSSDGGPATAALLTLAVLTAVTGIAALTIRTRRRQRSQQEQ
jgi:hypothetical protein